MSIRKAQGVDPALCLCPHMVRQKAALLRFAIDNVTANDWIILLELQPVRVIAAVLGRQIHVSTFGAFQLNDLARTLLSHGTISFKSFINLQTLSIGQTG